MSWKRTRQAQAKGVFIPWPLLALLLIPTAFDVGGFAIHWLVAFLATYTGQFLSGLLLRPDPAKPWRIVIVFDRWGPWQPWVEGAMMVGGLVAVGWLCCIVIRRAWRRWGP